MNPLRPIAGASSMGGYGGVAAQGINAALYKQGAMTNVGLRKGGYGSAAAVGMRRSPLANEVRAANRGRRQAGIAMARNRAAQIKAGQTTRVNLGPTRRASAPVVNSGSEVVQGAVNSARKLPKMGRGLMIGAGAAVVAGLAYSGRRGEGSSGGRTSMTRY